MADILDYDIQLSERAINELKLLANSADDFSTLADLCSTSAHLGGSTNLRHLQSLLVSYIDCVAAMEAVAEQIETLAPEFHLVLK